VSKLILVRHGQSTWNIERRIQGTLDPPLSDEGRRQAEALARRLRGLELAAIYASPRRRALETAEIVARGLGRPVLPHPALAEIGLGAWEGRTVAELRASYGQAYDRWLDAPQDHAPPGAEPAGAFVRRVVDGIGEMAGAHPEGTVLLATHAMVVRAVVGHAIGLDFNRAFRVPIDNVSITEVAVRPGPSFRLRTLNDVCHLDGWVERAMAGAAQPGEEAAL
jgi:broad specificity phosphatase PhoE